MLSWLHIRKPKPSAALSALRKAARNRGGKPAAAPSPQLRIDTAALKPHPLLALLPSGTLDRLIGESAVAEYPKGTVIFREGDPGEAIYLIISGRCEARAAGDGTSHVEEVFGPGDTLGERAFLNREPHRHSAVVVTHAVLLRIPAAELQGLFAKDPALAGRFSQAMVQTPRAHRGHAPGRGAPVRRVVSLISLSQRVDADAVVHALAAAERSITGQRVLVLRLGPSREDVAVNDLCAQKATMGVEFCFARNIHSQDGGFDELRLSASPEPRDVAAIAPLISHCALHYDYVFLHIHGATPVPPAIECLAESDLSFVLMQASTQNLYDFELFMRALNERTRGNSSNVKPILCVEESIAAPEVHAALKRLGHPVHSFARGFPLHGAPVSNDHRFKLMINRIAREIGRRRIGLALSSGGAKGLSHIGVIQVLEENGIEIDCIAGSSMGAYVGAIWAAGIDGAGLEKIAREHEGRWGLWKLLDPAVPPRRGFIHTRRTAARLRRSIGDTHFSELVRPLRVLATHLQTLERVVFSGGEVVSAVEASIAIPGVCVPVTLDGETYIDGGISDPLPVDVLEEIGIERIIAVNVIPPPERIRQWYDCRKEQSGRETRGWGVGDFFNRHFNYLAQGNILDIMMQAVNGAQTRVAEAAAREADVVLRPLAGDAEWHDFTHPQKYIALGRDVAEAQLSALKALAGNTQNEPAKPLAIESSIAA
jgi:NTE family protein